MFNEMSDVFIKFDNELPFNQPLNTVVKYVTIEMVNTVLKRASSKKEVKHSFANDLQLIFAKKTTRLSTYNSIPPSPCVQPTPETRKIPPNGFNWSPLCG